MLFRNLASMDVEESIRANPIDGVVLLVGCDKTTPALLMGAASCDLPTHRGLRRADAQRPLPRPDHRLGHPCLEVLAKMCKAGEMTLEDFMEAEAGMSRSAGHCMTMGTASTMASMVEALGIGLPDNAAIPAVDSRRYVLAHLAGRRIVEMVQRGSAHVEDPDARGLRERDPRQRRHRRLDQRGRPSARDRRPHRRRSHARRLGPARPRRALPRQPDAVGQVPDGGFLLRRRPAGGDAASSATLHPQATR